MDMVILKNGNTIFLRGVVLLIGGLVLAFCLAALYLVFSRDMGAYTPILVGMSASSVATFYALYQTIKLLGYIDKNEAFSELSVRALRNIKYCALTISSMFTLGMPYIYYVGEVDDAPGVILIGLLIIFTTVVVATFGAVLQRILQDALDIKSENDLTV